MARLQASSASVAVVVMAAVAGCSGVGAGADGDATDGNLLPTPDGGPAGDQPEAATTVPQGNGSTTPHALPPKEITAGHWLAASPVHSVNNAGELRFSLCRNATVDANVAAVGVEYALRLAKIVDDDGLYETVTEQLGAATDGHIQIVTELPPGNYAAQAYLRLGGPTPYTLQLHFAEPGETPQW